MIMRIRNSKDIYLKKTQINCPDSPVFKNFAGIKAIVGSGVIFLCQAQIKVLIAKVPMPFTECQISTSFSR